MFSGGETQTHCCLTVYTTQSEKRSADVRLWGQDKDKDEDTDAAEAGGGAEAGSLVQQLRLRVRGWDPVPGGDGDQQEAGCHHPLPAWQVLQVREGPH